MSPHRFTGFRAWALVLAAAVWGAGLQASRQDAPTGEVFGSVVDPDRGFIPGATITLDGRRLPTPVTVTSDKAGLFRIPGLAAGTYFVRTQLKGFTTLTRENVAVAAGSRVEVTTVLKVAGFTDRVEPSGLKLAAGEIAVRLETIHGDIYVAIDTAHAPVTSANFLKYVDGGFYNLGRFHRVTRPDNYAAAPPDRPMMEIIQGGPDPFRFRDAFPPIALERTSVTGVKHVVGTISMARGGPDTATSDFFICLDDQPSLDFGGKRFPDEQGAAAFGRVVYGMDIVRKIQQEKPLRPAPNQQYLETPLPIVSATSWKK